MASETRMGCVLVGHTHQRLSDGLRGWLLASFEGVFMVADSASLTEGARKLQPELIVVDLALAAGRLGVLLAELRRQAPHSRSLVLSDYDDARVDASILSTGADGVVHKASLAADLQTAVDAVLQGRRFGPPPGDP
jgi:DNA-binding NarL/FixJ family response regulator